MLRHVEHRRRTRPVSQSLVMPRASEVTWHPTAVRTCKLCGQAKPLDEFSHLKGTPYYRPECKPCRAKRDRERYQSDPAFRAREIARVHRNQQLMRLRRKHTQRPDEPGPNPDEILSYVAVLGGVTVDDLCGPSRSRRLIDARAAALYLLRTDAGLTPDEAGEKLGRSGSTVRDLARRAKQQVQRGQGDLYSIVNRVRRGLHSPFYDGALANAPEWSRVSRRILYALADQRRAAGLTQPELAAKSGIARETIGRLERCHRPAQPSTVRALAAALGVVPSALRET
jgi:DNA-binding XRE family transcriptional regulator